MTLLTIRDVSERLRIKRSTLYAWAEQGCIPHLKLGRLIRFDPDEIESWLQTHRQDPAPEPTPRKRRSSHDQVDDLIAQAKREVYTSSRGKPDKAGPNQEVNNGSV